MPVRVRIPTALRTYADGQSNVEFDDVKTVGDALDTLTEKYPNLKQHLLDDQGRVRQFVNLYVNREDVREKENLDTPVTDGDTLLIVPSVAGGAGEPRPDGRSGSGVAGGAGGAVSPGQAPRGQGAGSLTNDEVQHYARHLIMPEVGLAGQEKLKNAKVLMVGTGGLGAPSALYLAAAGVGTIGLVDFDTVDRSNLHRQVLFGEKDVGRPKVEAAAERLRQVNPHINVVTHDTPFTSENARDLLKDYDILVDGTDNFPTRYLSNDVAVLEGKPNVYASIFRFEGQASVFWAEKGPCYRCLYPEPPPPGLVPSCAEGGVLGVLPGIMGSIQAAETVKLILGKGDSLVGRLMLFDALSMTFDEVKLRKNPDCPVCGENPTVTELIDYQEFCGIRGEEEEVPEGIPSVTPKELAAELESANPPVVVDVREPHEWDIVHIPKATLIPLNSLAERVSEIPQNADVVLHCRSGVRSAKALELLRSFGYKRVRNLEGGVLGWADEVDPSLPKY